MTERKSRTTSYKFIDLVLLYEGEITNERLRTFLNVSNVQASRVLAAYSEEFPDNLERQEGGGKSKYRIARAFKSHVSDGAVWSYMKIASADSAITTVNDLVDLADVRPEIFRILRSAVREAKGVRALYRSMNNPLGKLRTLFPHAIMFVGRRWHVRAYDEERREFRDFNVGRLQDIDLLHTSSPRTSLDDHEWSAEVSIQLIAHPDLSIEQQKLIRDEFFKGAAARVIRCRGALVKYMVREMEIAVNVKEQTPPDYQLALGNIKNVGRWLFENKAVEPT